MITRRVVWALGVSQLTLWGVSYYLVAVFGGPIGQETGWSRTTIFGGFSAALVVMGLASPFIGRLVDWRGGRLVMSAGSILTALALLAMAASWNLASFYAAWILLGLAMRMTLYDAAFAALARLGGPSARGPISQITLLGGLASTVLWPVGQALVEGLGWRGGLVVYAGFALATLPLHLAIPADRYVAVAGAAAPVAPRAVTQRQRLQAGFLYAAGVTLTSVLNSAMSAHMIAILSGLGMAAGVAVWIASLRGIGQSAARLGEVLFGRRFDPLALGFLAGGLLPLGFVAGLLSGTSLAAGIAFALLYGAGNGLTTIVRGTQPLVLFDPSSYGEIVGRLLGPSFFLAALAPTAFALIMDRFGEAAALVVSATIAALAAACAAALWALFRTGANAGS